MQYLANRGRSAGRARSPAPAGGRRSSPADLADLGAVAGVVYESATTLGKPSLLVNNASIFEEDHVGTLEPALFNRQMTVNFAAPVFLAQAFADALADGDEGNIVNIVDQRVWRTDADATSPTRCRSRRCGPRPRCWPRRSRRASASTPSRPARCCKNARQDAGRIPRADRARVPLGRGPELAEFGRTVRYLVENRSITGQMIGLDGGQHLVWETPDMAEFDDRANEHRTATTADAGEAGRSAREVIAGLIKRLPNGPGVYRMIDAKGTVLYVGKARSLKKRVAELHAARRPVRPHRPHDRGDRDDGVRLDPHRDRGAAPRGEPHQAPAPALQRAAARRQVVPLHPDHRRPPGAGDRQASRRAQPEGQLFRPLRLGRRGRPHDQRAAARVPASAPARTPSTRAARGPACSTRSSAARRPAPARSRSTTTPSSSTRRRRSSPARARRCATEIAARRWRRPRSGSISRPPPSTATASPPSPTSRPTRASIRAASRRPTSSPSTRTAAQTCIEVFFFRTGQNWGNRAYFPRADREPRARARCSAPSSPSSTTTSRCRS